MSQRVLIDTAPLVASINKSDRFHEWAKARFAQIYEPMLTCEAVLTESFFLLRQQPKAISIIFEMLERKVIEVPFQIETHFTVLHRLMAKYASLPMSFADACLVCMSEIYDDSVVLTCDRHFKIYRKHSRQVIPVLMPPE